MIFMGCLVSLAGGAFFVVVEILFLFCGMVFFVEASFVFLTFFSLVFFGVTFLNVFLVVFDSVLMAAWLVGFAGVTTVVFVGCGIALAGAGALGVEEQAERVRR